MDPKGPESLGEILSRLFTARGWGRRQDRLRLEEAWAAAVAAWIVILIGTGASGYERLAAALGLGISASLYAAAALESAVTSARPAFDLPAESSRSPLPR